MNVQFDWRFEEDNENGATANWDDAWYEPIHRGRSPVRSRYRRVERRMAATSTVFSTDLTGHQRRVYAALARTKPWLCPIAQPESFARRSVRRRGLVRSRLVGLRNRLRHRAHRIKLTRRQCRLHAAVARTRPWDCPYGRPE